MIDEMQLDVTARRIVNEVERGTEVRLEMPDEAIFKSLRRQIYLIGKYTIKTRGNTFLVKKRENITEQIRRIIKVPEGEYVLPTTDKQIVSQFVNRNFKGVTYNSTVEGDTIRIKFHGKNAALKEKLANLPIADLRDIQKYVNSLFND